MFVSIETRLISRLVQEHLCDEDYAELQRFLLETSTAGVVIPRSGGVRKL